MGTNLKNRDHDPDEDRPGLDFLRSLAGYPVREVHVGKHQVRSRIVEIHRDALGRVLGSSERLEESEYLDADGSWLD